MPLTFSQQILHGANCLHTAPLLSRLSPPRPTWIDIGKLNIRDGRGFGLAQAIQVVERSGLDVISLNEIIQKETCSNNWRGYGVRGTVARPPCASGAQDG